MKTIAITKRDHNVETMENEISALEVLVQRRRQWMQDPANKRRGTYEAVAADTRQLVAILDRKRSELIARRDALLSTVGL